MKVRADSPPGFIWGKMSGLIFHDEIDKARALIKKLCKEGGIDKEGWNFLINLVSGAYLVSSLGLMLLTTSNASLPKIAISMSIFCPIWFSLFFFKSFRKSLDHKRKLKTYGAVALTVTAFLFFGLAGMGYTDFVNALSSGQEIRLAEGRIEKIEPRRRNGPRVDIFDSRSTIENIPITDEEYATLHVGDYYVSNMRLGGLGYYYRWRFDSWNRGWDAKRIGNQGGSRSVYKD
jgi:hypothetical protein